MGEIPDVKNRPLVFAKMNPFAHILHSIMIWVAMHDERVSFIKPHYSNPLLLLYNDYRILSTSHSTVVGTGYIKG